MKHVIILRGLPGSGKTSFVEDVIKPDAHIEADQFFVDEKGEYHFDQSRQGLAHKDAMVRFEKALSEEKGKIVVSNTSSRRSEFWSYLKKAKEKGYRVSVMVMENYHKGGDVHNTPKKVIEGFRKNFEINL